LGKKAISFTKSPNLITVFNKKKIHKYQQVSKQKF